MRMNGPGARCDVGLVARRMIAAITIVVVVGPMVACVDDAETPYGVCKTAAEKGDVKAAASACDDAMKKSPSSKYGKLAAAKRGEIQPALDKVLAQEKADAEKAAAAKKAADDAAAKAAAEQAEKDRKQAILDRKANRKKCGEDCYDAWVHCGAAAAVNGDEVAGELCADASGKCRLACDAKFGTEVN
jgi:hypothetical protein